METRSQEKPDALHERVIALEQQQVITNYTLKGNGVMGVTDRLAALEKGLRRTTYIVIATFASALAGGIDGVVQMISVVVGAF